jgi:antitoxin component of MazEF toxin-antitoxin module
MLARITQVGTSVGVIIPRYIAAEAGFKKGSPINIEYRENAITITKATSARHGWADAFAAYASEGEDEQLIPDHIDIEAIELTERI